MLQEEDLVKILEILDKKSEDSEGNIDNAVEQLEGIMDRITNVKKHDEKRKNPEKKEKPKMDITGFDKDINEGKYEKALSKLEDLIEYPGIKYGLFNIAERKAELLIPYLDLINQQSWSHEVIAKIPNMNSLIDKYLERQKNNISSESVFVYLKDLLGAGIYAYPSINKSAIEAKCKTIVVEYVSSGTSNFKNLKNILGNLKEATIDVDVTKQCNDAVSSYIKKTKENPFTGFKDLIANIHDAGIDLNIEGISAQLNLFLSNYIKNQQNYSPGPKYWFYNLDDILRRLDIDGMNINKQALEANIKSKVEEYKKDPNFDPFAYDNFRLALHRAGFEIEEHVAQDYELDRAYKEAVSNFNKAIAEKDYSRADNIYSEFAQNDYFKEKPDPRLAQFKEGLKEIGTNKPELLAYDLFYINKQPWAKEILSTLDLSSLALKRVEDDMQNAKYNLSLFWLDSLFESAKIAGQNIDMVKVNEACSTYLSNYLKSEFQGNLNYPFQKLEDILKSCKNVKVQLDYNSINAELNSSINKYIREQALTYDFKELNDLFDRFQAAITESGAKLAVDKDTLKDTIQRKITAYQASREYSEDIHEEMLRNLEDAGVKLGEEFYPYTYSNMIDRSHLN